MRLLPFIVLHNPQALSKFLKRSLSMIIWSGLGLVVPGIAFVCFLFTQITIGSIFNDEKYYTQHGWPKLLAFLVAAGLVGLVGSLLSKRGSKVYIEKATGKEIVMGRNDSFFFIPVLYWAPLLVILGFVFLFI
jgi:hypothetical protein